jgi:hypothetical protein
MRSCLLGAVGLALILAGCGGGGSPITPVPSAAPTPRATPTPAPTPTPNTTCGLAPGPVVRYAVRPREDKQDNRKVDMRVRARPGFDEVWCIDKDGSHQLDLDSNQRNEENRECCWVYDPQWTITDPNALVTGQEMLFDNPFLRRLFVEPKGREGVVRVRATLDGVNSRPWQTFSGYAEGPLIIVSMSRAEIERDCNCIFLGNGRYAGTSCPK